MAKLDDGISLHQSESLIIKYKLLHPSLTPPTKAHDTDAGWDLYSALCTTVYPGEVLKIPTGIAISIPTGYVGIIKGRSSVSSQGIDIFGGVIDSGYIGELSILLYNTNKEHDFYVGYGHKIAQMLILPVPDVEFLEVDSLEETQRGEKGWGSSGI